MTLHASDSSVQREAEAWILAWVEKHLDFTLVTGHRLTVDDATVEIDGATADESVLVEVFAHHGPLKGGQSHKVSTDVLKLITVAKDRHPRPRLILALADNEAAASLSGKSWRAASLRSWGVEVLVAELTDAQHAAIRATQARQTMIKQTA